MTEGKDLTFLVVDDNDTIRTIMPRFLQNNFPGCRVVTAASFEEAKVALHATILTTLSATSKSAAKSPRWVKAFLAAPSLKTQCTIRNKQVRTPALCWEWPYILRLNYSIPHGIFPHTTGSASRDRKCVTAAQLY